MWSGREIAVKDAAAAAAPVGVAGAVLGSAAALRPSEERLEACSYTVGYNFAPSHKTRPYLFLPLKEHPETSCRKVLFILTDMDSSSAKRFRGHVFTSSGLFYANITLPAVALSGLPTPSITGLFQNPRSGTAFFFPWNWDLDLELKLISAALSARPSALRDKTAHCPHF